jgi:hypothetical protein
MKYVEGLREARTKLESSFQRLHGRMFKRVWRQGRSK